MKRTMLSALVMASVLPVSGHADQCSANHATKVNAGNTVQGMTVCASGSSGSWQEYHAGNGNSPSLLKEYALGPGHPVDPSHEVGTWERASADTDAITYTYTGGSAYTFELWERTNGADPDPYVFCTAGAGTTEVAAVSELKPTETFCGSSPP